MKYTTFVYSILGILLMAILNIFLSEYLLKYRTPRLIPNGDLMNGIAATPPQRSRKELAHILYTPALYANLNTDQRIQLTLEFVQQIGAYMTPEENLQTRKFLLDAILQIVPPGEVS